MTPLMTAGAAALGILVGFVSALFGIGGGLVIVPFIVLALGETQQLAEGTSLLVIIPTAIAGVVAHRRRDLVSFRHAALLGAGGVVGAVAGALLALRIEPADLEAVFAVFLAVMGLRLVLDGWRSRR